MEVMYIPAFGRRVLFSVASLVADLDFVTGSLNEEVE